MDKEIIVKIKKEDKIYKATITYSNGFSHGWDYNLEDLLSWINKCIKLSLT